MSQFVFKKIDPLALECAAAYGRKSTNQEKVADDQTSVATQIAEGTSAAAEIGHFVGPKETCVFEDYDISGAEYDSRPGWSRLMAVATSGRAKFKTLIVRNISRIGREPIEALMNLKRLDQAGIRIYLYLDREFIDMSDEIKVMMLILKAFAAGSQRSATRREVAAAMQRKARAGHVIGVVPYGYRRVEIRNGEKRSHVMRKIDPTEAAVVRRIYQLYLQGHGMNRIGRALDESGARPRRGTRWTATTIRGILANEIYRGEAVSHRYCFQDKWGMKIKGAKNMVRSPSEWIRVQTPDDRIVSDAVWYAVEAKRKGHVAARVSAIAAGRRVGGPPTRDVESVYLLVGFVRCHQCKGPMCVIRRNTGPSGLWGRAGSPGVTRQGFYGCLKYHRSGHYGCSNATTVQVERLHAAILAEVLKLIERPGLVERIIKEVVRRSSASNTAATVAQLKTAITKVERECERLHEMGRLAKRPLATIVAKLEEREPQLEALKRQLAVTNVKTESADVLIKRARKVLASAKQALSNTDVAVARQFLRRALLGPIVLTPAPNGERLSKYQRKGPLRNTHRYQFEGGVSLLSLFRGIAPEGLPMSDVSHTGSDTNWKPIFKGIAS